MMQTLKHRGYITEPGWDNMEKTFELVMPMPFIVSDDEIMWFSIYFEARNHPRLVRAL